MSITSMVPNCSKVTPFSFEESRVGILVYFTRDIADILQPRKRGPCTCKKLSEINDSINNFGPFKVYLNDGTKEIFQLLQDAILYGEKTETGSVASIYNRNDNYIGYVDAT